ncbi:MAG TPA: hypothetical protein VGI39_36360 [Polyangiaceae bacterium]|jgi:hypothetical protein
MKLPLVSFLSLSLLAACSAQGPNPGPESAIATGEIVAANGPLTLAHEAHVEACLLGGSGIDSDGTSTKRACERIDHVTALPVKFAIQAPATLEDPQYAVTAAVYLGEDEGVYAGDFLSDIKVVTKARLADLQELTLTADAIHLCSSGVGGACSENSR